MTVDYAAEVKRTRTAQGLPVQIPRVQREAVEALLAAADLDHDEAGVA